MALTLSDDIKSGHASWLLKEYLRETETEYRLPLACVVSWKNGHLDRALDCLRVVSTFTSWFGAGETLIRMLWRNDGRPLGSAETGLRENQPSYAAGHRNHESAWIDFDAAIQVVQD